MVSNDLMKNLEKIRNQANKSRFNKIHFVLDDINQKKPTEECYRFLILLEPPSVMPENYNTKKWTLFEEVILLSPWRARMYNSQVSIFQPLERPNFAASLVKSQESNISFISDLKFGSVSSSLYGWRLDLLKQLSRKGIEVQVFGTNWGMSKSMEIRKRVAATRRALSSSLFTPSEAWSSLFFRPKSYLGRSSNKLDTLRQFGYTLVIENDENSLTEKLFDAIFSGARVFYRGPKLSNFEFLNHLCFELPPNLNEAVDFILNRNELDWHLLEDKRELFIKDPDSMIFCDGDFVAGQILKIVEKFMLRKGFNN